MITQLHPFRVGDKVVPVGTILCPRSDVPKPPQPGRVYCVSALGWGKDGVPLVQLVGVVVKSGVPFRADAFASLADYRRRPRQRA